MVVIIVIVPIVVVTLPSRLAMAPLRRPSVLCGGCRYLIVASPHRYVAAVLGEIIGRWNIAKEDAHDAFVRRQVGEGIGLCPIRFGNVAASVLCDGTAPLARGVEPHFGEAEERKGPGCYVIGEPRDPSQPITPATQFDDYMGWWPSNFRGLYIGISLSQREGIRGRLRCHARGRGCRGVREKLQSGANLSFLFIPGLAATNLEAVYVHMKQDEIFPLNTRSELRRQTKRFWAAHEEADRAAGREIVKFGEIPGYFEDG